MAALRRIIAEPGDRQASLFLCSFSTLAVLASLMSHNSAASCCCTLLSISNRRCGRLQTGCLPSTVQHAGAERVPNGLARQEDSDAGESLPLPCAKLLALEPALPLQTLRNVSRRRTLGWHRHACDPARCGRLPSRCAAPASPSACLLCTCMQLHHVTASRPLDQHSLECKEGLVQRSAASRRLSHAAHCAAWLQSMLGLPKVRCMQGLW